MTNLRFGAALLFFALLAVPSQVPAAQSPYDIDVKDLDQGKPAVTPKVSPPSAVHAAPSPFDIDVKELDRKKPAPPKAEKRRARKAKQELPAAAKKEVPPAAKGGRQHRAAVSENETGYLRYTVKPGDHIFKILMGRFGMTNEAAEKLIPEILRINNIGNIKTLTVGRTLLIPTGGRQERVAKSGKYGKSRSKGGAGTEAAATPAMAPTPAVPKVAASAVPAPAAGTAPVTVAPPAAPAVTVPAATVPPVAAPMTAPSSSVSAPPAASSAAAPTASSVTAPTAAPSVTALATPTATAPAVAAPAATPPPNVTATPSPAPATWICSVTEQNPTKIVDAVMNALSLHWSRNRIIRSGEGAPNAFSIRVDRYFELNGTRYIVSIGENDPYSYTLLRLLESAGCKVLAINSDDDFKAVGEKLLRLVGVIPDFGRHAVQGGKESSGFLVQQDDADGRRVLITNEPVNSKLKLTLPAGCGPR